MLLFGHTGITLGVAALATRAVNNRQAERLQEKNWFDSLSDLVDIRLLVIGSMLPDIIDKPLGQYFFSGTFSNGRVFAHTLLFLVLVTAAGWFLYRRRRQRWLLTLAAGVFTHLAFDEMWQVPATIFWPVLGLQFPRYELTGWATGILQALASNPYVYVSEAVGLAVIIWFGITLIRRKRLLAFIWQGKT
jgi:inner membrane protein